METKGVRINAMAKVIDTGTMGHATFPWDIAYIRFEVNGVEYLWHSENCVIAADHLLKGDNVQLEAFTYGNRLRRVTVVSLRTFQVYGMNAPKCNK